MLMPSNVDRYWEQYLASIPGGRQRSGRYRGGSTFGMTPDDARGISHLVLDGTKTATGSLLWSWKADGKPLPKAGDLWVVTSGPDEPVCVIETVEVRVIPYEEVPEQYALDGGEGDRTLVTWRRIYWEYIVHECRRIGVKPDVKAPLAMERFKVVYSKPLVRTTWDKKRLALGSADNDSQ